MAMNLNIEVSTAALTHAIVSNQPSDVLFPHRTETTATHVKCIFLDTLLCLKVKRGYSVMIEMLKFVQNALCMCMYQYIGICEGSHTHISLIQ